MTDTSIGYKPGNIADQFKHSNLETMVDIVWSGPLQYIELHSGEGMYDQGLFKEPYKGSALRALGKMKNHLTAVSGFLHEIRDEARAKLTANLKGYPDIVVRKDWRDHMQEYLEMADGRTLFVIDPVYAIDYLQRDNATGKELREWIPEMAKKGSGVFAFLPIAPLDGKADLDRVRDISILHSIQNAIRETGQDAASLGYVKDPGFQFMDYYNIVVASHNVLGKVINNHTDLSRRLQRRAIAEIHIPHPGRGYGY